MEFDQRMLEMKLQGLCCSQIIVAMGLEDAGLENPGLVAAMRAFCNGMDAGRLCGTISAAVSLLFLLAPEEELESLREELVDWFLDAYGSLDCDDILHMNPGGKLVLCPQMVSAVYEKLKELLQEALNAE